MEKIRRLFGKVLSEAPADDTPAQTDSVRAILHRLEELPAERARYVAAFAYVLARAAHADRYLSDVEVKRMKQILMRIGGLSADLVHPADNGMINMGENLAARIAPIIAGLQGGASA